VLHALVTRRSPSFQALLHLGRHSYCWIGWIGVNVNQVVTLPVRRKQCVVDRAFHLRAELLGASAAHQLRELRTASRELKELEQLKEKAVAKVAAARAAEVLMRSKMDDLAYIPAFTALRHKLCSGDRWTAFHIWTACGFDAEMGPLTCGLHLDDLDLAHLFDLVVSLGVSPSGAVVELQGSLLMVVLNFASANLGTLKLAGDIPQAHDQHGNIVLLDPPSLELLLPAEVEKVNSPDSPAGVGTALQDGRCVVAFFRSGGWLAGQLAQHWHAVTPMDPRDIIAGYVRFGFIAYAQRSACVAGYAATSQNESCTYEGTHALAEEMVRAK